MKTRILVADDHTLLRAGLVKLLESVPGVEVIGQASDGLEVSEVAPVCTPKYVRKALQNGAVGYLLADGFISKATFSTDLFPLLDQLVEKRLMH
jgi:hypothetical protein